MTAGSTDPRPTGRPAIPARSFSPWARVAATVIVLAILALLVWLVRQGTRPRNWADRFRYELSDFKRFDPKLMIGRELTPLPLSIGSPRALAVDRSNRIYVGGDSAIEILESDGRPVRTVETHRRITCLTVGAENTLYAGATGMIAVFDSNAVMRAEWAPPGTNAFITSLAANDTTLFAADAGQRIVWRFDLNGKLIGSIGAKDKKSEFPGFFIPSPYFDLALAPDGALWVVDPGRHKFIHFSPDGDVLSSWERTGIDIDGFSGCCNPSHIAIRADGSFVTSEKSVVRVKIHAVTGSLLGVLAGPDRFGPDTRGLDLAVDGNGHILVLDPERAVILVFVLEDK